MWEKCFVLELFQEFAVRVDTYCKLKVTPVEACVKRTKCNNRVNN